MPKLSEVASEELRGREYLKPYLEKDAMEVLPELLKKLDGAETLIGKRPAVPARDAADALYKKLIKNKIEVLYDDRDVRAGEKFADSDRSSRPASAVRPHASRGRPTEGGGPRPCLRPARPRPLACRRPGRSTGHAAHQSDLSQG